MTAQFGVNESHTVGTWTRPRDGRTRGERLRDGYRAFLRAYRRRDAVTVEVISGGGGGSARVTQMF